MNDFSFGKGRRLFTHIKRHRPDIEGQNDFDCLEADGFVEHNIDLPSDFNLFDHHEESSLEAIKTDLDNSDIRPTNEIARLLQGVRSTPFGQTAPHRFTPVYRGRDIHFLLRTW